MRSMAPSLSRTSSATSVSSDDATTTRRTRKRFTNVQLMMLEHLFHQTSHPTRDERETLAKDAGMEIKSVTIWFQNKRQTERKVALHNATNSNDSSVTHTPTPNASPPPSLPTAIAEANRRASRPSLDRVAARSELRAGPHRTPFRRHNPTAAPWDNMPSSPLAPPTSPSQNEYVDFSSKHGRSRRTLEWACAAARIAEKEGTVPEKDFDGSTEGSEGSDDGEETVTPDSHREYRRVDRRGSPYDMHSKHRRLVVEEDVMRAALALCGLGRR